MAFHNTLFVDFSDHIYIYIYIDVALKYLRDFQFPISICITLCLCLIVIFDGVKLLIRVVRSSYLSFYSGEILFFTFWVNEWDLGCIYSWNLINRAVALHFGSYLHMYSAMTFRWVAGWPYMALHSTQHAVD